jgi:hypothetical protein
MTLSFQNAKSSLATAVPLKHPDPTAPLSLATDASNSHVGAVLQQKSNGELVIRTQEATGIHLSI